MPPSNPAAQLGVEIRDLFLGMSSEWRTFQTCAMARHERLGLFFLCGAFMVELSFAGRAWTDDSSVDFEAVARGVWIDVDRSSILPGAIRRAVPAWKGRAVATQIGEEMRARLTPFGEQNRASVAKDSFAAGANLGREVLGDLFLNFLVINPIKGHVSLRITGQSSTAPGAVARDQVTGEGLLDILRQMTAAQQSIATAIEAREGPTSTPRPLVGLLRIEHIRKTYPGLTDRQLDSVRKRLEEWRKANEDAVMMGEEDPESGRRRYAYPADVVARFVEDALAKPDGKQRAGL